ncbi:MAG: four-carbon acid sugar kinase family protein [Enterocloster bolteae]
MGNIHSCQIRPGTGACGETEFAADRTFGYRSSNLADYVEEKTKGAYPAGEVICIGLDDLRHGRVDKVAGQLMEVRNFNKVIVNAVDYGDLKVFALALYEAMEQGKRFLFRTAAPGKGDGRHHGPAPSYQGEDGTAGERTRWRHRGGVAYGQDHQTAYGA